MLFYSLSLEKTVSKNPHMANTKKKLILSSKCTLCDGKYSIFNKKGEACKLLCS